MKHLKKLSVVLMMTTLFSVSFTSCIDNEVSPLVEAIYEAQADLIAAQAGVQNAEAALRLAQASHQQAQTALLNAQIADGHLIAEGNLALALANAGLLDAQAQAILSASEGNLAQALADAGFTEAQAAHLLAEVAIMNADAAYAAAVREQTIRELMAQTDLDIANLENALALAETQFTISMNALLAQLQAAGANLAAGYAIDFRNAMLYVNSLSAQKLNLEKTLADKMLMMSLGETATPGVYLEQLEIDLANLIASGVAAQQTIDELEAYLADPSNKEGQVLALQAQRADLLEANAAIDVEIAGLQNTIQDINNQIAANNNLMTLYNNKKSYRNTQIGLRDAKIAQNTTLTTANTAAQLAITNYPSVTTTLTTAKNDAITAQTTAGTNVTNAVAALGTSLGTPNYLNSAIAPANTLYKELWNAQLAFYVADNNLTVHNTALGLLYTTYITAATNYEAAQSLYEAGIGAAQLTLTNLITARSNALTALNTAQNAYSAALLAFESFPTGSTWNNPGADGLMGIHTDDAAPLLKVETYAVVTAVAPVTFGAARYPSIVGGGDLTVAQFALVNNNYGTLAVGEYYNIEADDTSATNISILNAAVAALGNSIEDTADKDDSYILTGDARANYYNAQIDVLAQQYLVDNFGADRDLKKAIFEEQQLLYDEGLITKATLTSVRATALAAANDAQTAVTNATNALGVLITPAAVAGNSAISPANTLYKVKWNADLAVANTTLALSTHLATTVAMYQATITANNATIAANLLLIAEYNILINQAQLEMDALQAEYDALLATPLYAQLQVDKHIAQMAINELNAEKAANVTLRAQLQNIITAIGTTNIALINADISAAKSLLTGLPAQIAAKELAITKGEVDLAKLQLDIDNLNAQIAVLTIRIANAQAIADKYKALMDAALAS
ncbi:MAG: hypothetical protein Q7U21_08270 [Lutibacter sp.]|nr:hypothetical protein [Lutibacter sp.]